MAPEAAAARDTSGARPAPQVLTDADLPALFRAADSASLAGQRRFVRATAAQIILLLVAGAAGVLSLKLGKPPVDVGAAVAATAFISAAVLGTFMLQTGPNRTWFEGRAAAESAKTLAWRYAVGGEPFQVGIAGSHADDLMIASLTEVLDDLGGLTLDFDSEQDEQITKAMRQLRRSSLAERREAYLTGRIESQRKWYASRARLNAAHGQRWSMALLGLTIVGATAAVLRASGIPLINVLSIAAAAAVAANSWTQLKQHNAVASAYTIAALELATIKTRLGHQRTEAEWAAFVSDAEGAISREHTLWRASRGHGSRVADPPAHH